MKYHANAIINTVPAANQLRKVPGFDPLKFLRRTTSERTGEKVLKLDLPYKQLWFRLACPNGRMVVKPLRITDQLATFEAMVYAAKDDTEPLARFASTVSSEEVPDGRFVQAAQDMALNEALDNAGFGIQLCDLVEKADHSGCGSEIPVAKMREAHNVPKPQAQPQAQPVKRDAETPVNIVPPAAAPPVTAAKQFEQTVSLKESVHADNTAAPSAPINMPKSVTQSQPTPSVQFPPTIQQAPAVQPEPEIHQVTDVQQSPAAMAAETPQICGENAMSELLEQRHGTASADVQAVQGETPDFQPTLTVSNTESSTPAAAPTPGYTADMSVDDICQRMTLDEALNYKVETGVCKGWTLAQVAERRKPSLRFYVYAANSDNVLKAAATLVLNAA